MIELILRNTIGDVHTSHHHHHRSLVLLLVVALLVLPGWLYADSSPGLQYNPTISAIRYMDNVLQISGNRLDGCEVRWGDTQHRITILVPNGRLVPEGVVIEGSSRLIRRVTVVPEELEEPDVLTRLFRTPLLGDLFVEIELNEPALHVVSLVQDASALTVRFQSADMARDDRTQAEDADGGYATVTLQYGDVEAIASILRRLVDRGDRVIQVAPRRNQLILDRQMDRYLNIRDLIDRLDRPGDQILIDAQVVELNTDAASRLGLELSDSITIGLEEESDYGQAIALPLQTFLRSPVEVRATLHMLKGEGEAHILANPRVSTIDGLPAVMKTEERFPIIVTQSSGDQTYQTKQDIVGGIELSILPRHNGGGEITTEIVTDVTTITGTTKEGYPTTSSRQVETTVRVASGTAIVIGGLVEKREIRHRGRIPILGDIPFLGVLFTNYRTSTQETDLFVIVTPYLIGVDE